MEGNGPDLKELDTPAVNQQTEHETENLPKNRQQPSRSNPEAEFQNQNTGNKELFPSASPEQQIKSCYLTLNNLVLNYEKKGLTFNDQEIAAISLYKHLLKQISSDQIICSDPEIAQKAIRTTVALLDSTVVEEIAFGNDADLQGKDQYFREFGYYEKPGKDFSISVISDPRILFTVKDEQQKTLDLIKQTAKVATVSSANDLVALKKQNPDIIVFSRNMALEDTNTLLGSTRRSFPYTPIAAPFMIDQNLGGIFLDNTDTKKYNKLTRVLYPRTEVPRQEVWISLLGKGRVIFGSEDEYPEGDSSVLEDVPNKDPKLLLEELDNYWRIADLKKPERSYGYLRRKTGVWLNATQEKIGQFYSRHIERFKRVLADRLHPVHGEAEVILTRSGVSANETVIRTIAHQSGTSREDRPSLYIMNGFYYENIVDIDRDFNIAKDPNQARVFLINQEPSDPFVSLPYPQPYTQARDILIKNIIARAKQDTDNQYYIMYDKTHNLLQQTFTELDNIPANLTIAETGSLTKHQRGGRNYFFGVISAWGNQEFKKKLHESLSETRGNLTPLGVIHLPRLTKEEIEKRNAEFAAKTQVIAEEVERKQAEKGIPEKFRWKFRPQTYFGWFIPPTKALIEEMKNSATKQEQAAIKRDLREHFGYYFETELGFDPSLTDQALEVTGSNTPTILTGDSFGLNSTMITSFMMDLSKQYFKLFQNQIDPVFKEYGVLRISPGKNTSEEELKRYIDKLMDSLDLKMKWFMQLHNPSLKAA